MIFLSRFFTLDGSLSPFACGIAAAVVLESFELYLELRNLRVKRRATKPAMSLDETMSSEEFEAAKAYEVDRASFGIVESIYDATTALVFKLARVVPFLYRLTAEKTKQMIPETIPLYFFSLTAPPGGFLHTMAFLVACDVFTTLFSLPFSLYRTFVLEERHGFNKTTYGLFAKDTLKSFLLRLVLLYPLQYFFCEGVVAYFGPRFPFYFVGGAIALTFLFLCIYPTFIQPLFETFTPLEPSHSLYPKIQKLCEQTHFPTKKVYTVDGSKRSSHSNAYVIGFGKLKRIVIFDTLLKDLSEEEIQAVLCHELGHWKYWHVMKNMIFVAAVLVIVAFGARMCIYDPSFARDYGFAETNVMVGFMVFLDLFQSCSALIQFPLNGVAKRFEYQADEFAVSMGFGETLSSALTTLHAANKSVIEPDWLYATWNLTHPTGEARKERIAMLLKKKN